MFFLFPCFVAQVRQDVGALRGCCDELEGQLRATRQSAGSLAARAAQLESARQSCQQRSVVAERFLSVFTLLPAESAALASGEISAEFFSALARVHSIAASARLLVRSAAAQQAGLDILDRMGDAADAAYDKITTYAQQQFQHFSGESPEPPPLLRAALELLSRERPSLMKYCLEEIEQVRKQALVTAFVRALTVGGPGGGPAPIDTATPDDVVRQVSNMLAWLHQAAAAEAELLQSVAGGDRAAVASSVGSSMSSCCRPLRTRLEGILKSSQLDVVVAHELRSVLQFYRVTLAPFVGTECSFSELLMEFQTHFRAMFDSMVEAAALEARSQTTVHPDLGPPRFEGKKKGGICLITFAFFLKSLLHRTASYIGRIGETMEASLLPEEERTAAALLDPLAVPLLDMCDRMAVNLSPELGGVFLINCFVLLRDVIAPYAPAEALFRQLTLRIDAAVAVVCDAEARLLLTRSQLQPCLDAILEAGDGVNLSSLSGMDAKSLAENVRSLEGSVVGEAGLVLGTSAKVQDARAREKIRAAVIAKLVDTYEVLHKIVHDPRNNYPDQVMQYTPSQFKLLL